jgi:VCBS repeat-containing protein
MTQNPIDDYQSSLAMTVYMPLTGVFPSENGGGDAYFYLGELGIFAGNYDPAGEIAEGQLLPIEQDTALFSLLGTNYGGNGTSNFALPNLQGATLIGDGQGVGLPSFLEGEAVGAANVTLTTAEMPPVLGGTSQAFNNYEPSLPIQYEIGINGVFPSPDSGGALDMLGVVMPFAGSFNPGGFLACDGQLLPISQYTALFSILGTTYGGNGTTNFALPDLRGRDIVGASSTDFLGEQVGQSTVSLENDQVPTGGNTAQPFDNQQPSLVMNYIIALDGIFPSEEGEQSSTEPFLGQIVAFAGNFAPAGWALCDGQLLPINQYQALFSILGTQYGGNGITTFALPNLENSAVIGADDGSPVGTVVGANDPTITTTQLPAPNFEVVVVPETNEAGVAGYEGSPTEASGTAGTGGTGALAGDADIAGAALTVTAATGGTIGTPFATPYGTLTLSADGAYTYFANPASLAAAPTGTPVIDTITFAVTDSNGGTQNSTLSVTDYRNPTAVNETGTVGAGGMVSGTAGTSGTGALAGDADPDGDSITATAINDLGEPETNPIAGSYGTLTLNADGAYSYTADTPSALAQNFSASDDQPLTDSFTLLVAGPLATSVSSTLSIAVTEPAMGDFNGGNSGVLWHDPTTGDTGYWAVSNGVASWYDFGVAPTTYDIVGIGDFTGNGLADVLWRNPTSGDTGFWSITNNVASWQDLGTAPTSYGVVGVGDFTGDGSDDILWHNSADGDTGYWAVGGGTVSWTDLGAAPTSYDIVGVGDFNGNGIPDVLWRDPTSGDTGYWAISDGTPTWQDLGVAPTTYSVVGVGDFTGNGSDDILWHDSSSGDTGYWAVSDGTPTWYDLGVAPTTYNVVGVGEFAGNDLADVLWRDPTTGDTGYWAVVDGVTSWTDLGTAPTSYTVENGATSLGAEGGTTGTAVPGESLSRLEQAPAQSSAAQTDVSTLFQSIIGRAPDAAELVGMADQLDSGTTQAELQAALTSTGSAGGYTTQTAPAGNGSLIAPAGTPTLFAFEDVNFGNVTIAGFDPTRDTVELSSSQTANVAALQTDMSSVAAGTLITFSANQTILLNGVAPTSLGSANFLIG